MERMAESMKKIIPLVELKRRVTRLRNGKQKKVVFMSGVFDLFHYGHFVALKRASHCGDILVVQIDGNVLVKRRKGTDRPWLDERYRALMVASLEFVDAVFISDTPSEDGGTLKAVHPDRYIRAMLPHESDAIRSERETVLLKKFPSMRVIWLPQTPEISTTKIVTGIALSTQEEASVVDQFQFLFRRDASPFPIGP